MKSLGLMFAFFGMVASVAAVADLNSGRYDLHSLPQLLHGIAWILLGLLLFLLGMFFVKRDALLARRPPLPLSPLSPLSPSEPRPATVPATPPDR